MCLLLGKGGAHDVGAASTSAWRRGLSGCGLWRWRDEHRPATEQFGIRRPRPPLLGACHRVTGYEVFREVSAQLRKQARLDAAHVEERIAQRCEAAYAARQVRRGHGNDAEIEPIGACELTVCRDRHDGIECAAVACLVERGTDEIEANGVGRHADPARGRGDGCPEETAAQDRQSHGPYNTCRKAASNRAFSDSRPTVRRNLPISHLWWDGKKSYLFLSVCGARGYSLNSSPIIQKAQNRNILRIY